MMAAYVDSNSISNPEGERPMSYSPQVTVEKLQVLK
jgi:hypothetical protein